MTRYAKTMSQTLAEMRMNDPKLLKIFDKLKPKSTVKIKHSSTLEKGKDFIEYIVKSKNTLRNGVEKITLARKDSPTSVKRFLYNRDGKVTFAVGDMAASIDDIKENLEEGYEKEVLNVLDDAGIDGYFRNGKLYVDKRDAKAAKSALEDSDNIIKLPKMVKEEVEDLDEASARADAMRAMGRGKKVDPADVDEPKASAIDKASADKNMVMQMRRVMDVKGNATIEFGDGKKEKVDPKIVKLMLTAHDKIQKPRDKEKFLAMISKSKRDMLNVAKKLATLKMELDKEDEPMVKKVVDMLKKASNAHAGQAKDLEKAIKEALELDEMSYKPGSFKDTRPQEKTAKALDGLIKDGGLDKKDFQKARQLYVQASDAGSREKLKKFIYNLDTEPTEAIMDLIGRNDPETFVKMYPKSKEGERLTSISYAHRNVKAEAYKPVKSNHYDVKIQGVKKKDVNAILKYIKVDGGNYDIEDIDADQVTGGGMSSTSDGDIFIQGDDAGKLGMEIAKKFRGVKVMGEGLELDEGILSQLVRITRGLGSGDKDKKDMKTDGKGGFGIKDTKGKVIDFVDKERAKEILDFASKKGYKISSPDKEPKTGRFEKELEKMVKAPMQRSLQMSQEALELDEGKMKQFHMMMDDGKSAEEIAKALKLDLKTVKSLMKESLDTIVQKQVLYHKTFSDAMQHAYDYAKKKLGITVDPKEIDNKVATGPKKPSVGKTNIYRLKGKGGNLQIQVYNKGGRMPFELNMYKEENEMTKSLKDTIVEMWSEAVSPAQQAAIAISKKEKEEKDEGNAFGAALKAARDNGDDTFMVSGKKYKVEDYKDTKEKKLDPVGKEDGDIDNDGDKDATDKYLAKRRKAIGKAIKKDKKESFERYHETKQGSLRDAVLQMWGENIKEKKDLTKEKKDGSVKKMTDTGKEVTPVELSPKMPKVKESKNKV